MKTTSLQDSLYQKEENIEEEYEIKNFTFTCLPVYGLCVEWLRISHSRLDKIVASINKQYKCSVDVCKGLVECYVDGN